MSFRIIIFILYHSLHSCHSSWSHCWWLVWHSGLAAVISWGQVWAVNEIPQKKRHLERFCFWKWFERCCGGMNRGDLWFSFPNRGAFNTLYGQAALAEAEEAWPKDYPLADSSKWKVIKSPNSHLPSILHLCCRNKGALWPCSNDWASPEHAPGLSHCDIPWPLLLPPNPRGREFAPAGAELQISRGSCLSRKSWAAQPHLGPPGEVFPVRDRITPLHTHSPFLWPSCPRSSSTQTENQICF